MTRRISVLFLFLLVLAATVLGEKALAQELRRRAMLGFGAALVDPSKPADLRSNPVTIVQILDNSAASEAGLRAGDVIRTVDGVSITQPVEVSAPRRYAGDRVRITLSRGGQEINTTLVAKARPFETSANSDVLYRSVKAGESLRRIIITRPKARGRYPAVLIMGGLGCYSLDNLDRTKGYRPVIDSLEKKGYVTVRVEKPGEGDSEGPACTDPAATVQVEAEGYVAGLRAVKRYDFVDPARIYVFAHSMGPLVGSLVVTREPVAGLMAVETIGMSWFEYDVERYRYQQTLKGLPADQVDELSRAYDQCSYRFYIAKETPNQLLQTPACKSFFEPFAGVPYTYMHQVADISLAKQWKHADIPVLVVYGTASHVTSATQGRYLAEVINNLHPGRATYIEVPGMGHDLRRYESQLDFSRADDRSSRPFHEGFLETITTWLDRRS